jgi:hypothetical protein
MRILDAGHRYEIDGLDGGQSQIIQFVKRIGHGFPFNAGSAAGGTNCQEVLRVLIDRIDYLQRQKPCAESESISALLKTALMLFEVRAARHHGHTLALVDLMQCVREETCAECGHIGCEKHKVEANQ